MTVDSYKFLPRSMKTMYEATDVADLAPVWTPLPKPLHRCTVALMTSAGIYLKGQEPFDEEREKQEPTWGDPTYRVIPSDYRQSDVACSHLHINHDDLLEDADVVLPVRAFERLASAKVIGSLAPEHYSFMGYQDRKLVDWTTVQGPELAKRLNERAVDVLMLAPA